MRYVVFLYFKMGVVLKGRRSGLVLKQDGLGHVGPSDSKDGLCPLGITETGEYKSKVTL